MRTPRFPRETIEEPKPFSRPTDEECPRCSGTLLFARVECSDPDHGVACTQVHFGLKCDYCGLVMDETERPKPSTTGKRVLRSSIQMEDT